MMLTLVSGGELLASLLAADIYLHTHFPNIHLAVSLINATVLGVSPPVSAVLPPQNLVSMLYPVFSSGILKDAECCRAPNELFLY